MARQHAVITEEMLERLRAKIGVERPYQFQHNYEVTRDNIKHYVWGTGDNNPLYLDEEYAKKPRWGTIPAPPCFLYSMGRTGGGGGLPGIHALWGGAIAGSGSGQWFLAIRLMPALWSNPSLKSTANSLD